MNCQLHPHSDMCLPKLKTTTFQLSSTATSSPPILSHPHIATIATTVVQPRFTRQCRSSAVTRGFSSTKVSQPRRLGNGRVNG